MKEDTKWNGMFCRWINSILSLLWLDLWSLRETERYSTSGIPIIRFESFYKHKNIWEQKILSTRNRHHILYIINIAFPWNLLHGTICKGYTFPDIFLLFWQKCSKEKFIVFCFETPETVCGRKWEAKSYSWRMEYASRKGTFIYSFWSWQCLY